MKNLMIFDRVLPEGMMLKLAHQTCGYNITLTCKLFQTSASWRNKHAVLSRPGPVNYPHSAISFPL